MSDVKRYYVGINTKCLGGIGLVEMTDLYREATGFDGLVMVKDYDAIKVENESLRSDIQSWRLSIEAERNVHKLSLKGIRDELDRLSGTIFTEELAALRKLVSDTAIELRKASIWICREVEAGTTSATHWAIRLREKADQIDAAMGKGEQS